MEEVVKWIALTCVPNLGPRRIAAVYRELGSIDSFFQKNHSQLSAVLKLRLEQVKDMVMAVDLAAAKEAVAFCHRKGVELTYPQSPYYPELLKECHDPPPVLYYQGKLPQQHLVAVVGTRRATSYGRRVTSTLIPSLCHAGLGVVSGLARGIDTCAHKACLEEAGYTLAVLGNGVDLFYPYENHQLQKEILARGGCLLSEFPPATKPRPSHFPRRNRIISALSLGTLVVEAGLKSGAMITVGFALEQGRDVFAVPGNIDSLQSAGTNELIRLGAKPVTTATDILEEYNLSLPLQVQSLAPIPMSPEEQEIMSLLDEQGIGLDDLCFQMGVSGGVLLARLVALELKGLVERLPGQKYIRTNQGVQHK